MCMCHPDSSIRTAAVAIDVDMEGQAVSIVFPFIDNCCQHTRHAASLGAPGLTLLKDRSQVFGGLDTAFPQPPLSHLAKQSVSRQLDSCVGY